MRAPPWMLITSDPLGCISVKRGRAKSTDCMDKHMFRVWAIFCLVTLAILSWMPGQYMVRTSVLSGHEEHFLAYFLSAITISVAQRHNTHPSWVGLALVLYAGVLELGQLYVPGRIRQLRIFARVHLAP